VDPLANGITEERITIVEAQKDTLKEELEDLAGEMRGCQVQFIKKLEYPLARNSVS
jgi:hypothetical protein